MNNKKAGMLKKYIPGTAVLALFYLYIVLAYTLGIKSLIVLPVIVYAQYRLIRLMMPRKKKGTATR